MWKSESGLYPTEYKVMFAQLIGADKFKLQVPLYRNGDVVWEYDVTGAESVIKELLAKCNVDSKYYL